MKSAYSVKLKHKHRRTWRSRGRSHEEVAVLITIFHPAAEILNAGDGAVILPLRFLQLHSSPEASGELRTAAEAQGPHLHAEKHGGSKDGATAMSSIRSVSRTSALAHARPMKPFGKTVLFTKSKGTMNAAQRDLFFFKQGLENEKVQSLSQCAGGKSIKATGRDTVDTFVLD